MKTVQILKIKVNLLRSNHIFILYICLQIYYNHINRQAHFRMIKLEWTFNHQSLKYFKKDSVIIAERLKI